jgi:hypothetical protein
LSSEIAKFLAYPAKKICGRVPADNKQIKLERISLPFLIYYSGLRKNVAVSPRLTMKLAFVASKPPPPQVAYQEILMAAEAGIEYFS